MNRALISIADLLAARLVASKDAPALERVAAHYAVAVTPDIAARITTPYDPLARQFLPSSVELDIHANESPDPIGDHPHSPVKGLVHRYRDRVLIKLTHTCPVYCRFCFRREMVGPSGDGNMNAAEIDAAFTYLAAHPEIVEVIFTGGDPLMLSPRRISALGKRLAAIGHIRLVRWHSRVPVLAPERITPALIESLRFPGRTNFVSVHANHACEFSHAARAALARLADAGITLLGQTVLLKGVNDEAETLRALFTEMAANRIRPVYLHHPDLAPGTAHFRPSVQQGRAIHRALRGTLPGHAIPAYVLDIPGGFGKVSLDADNLRVEAGRVIAIRDPSGHWRDYAE